MEFSDTRHDHGVKGLQGMHNADIAQSLQRQPLGQGRPIPINGLIPLPSVPGGMPASTSQSTNSATSTNQEPLGTFVPSMAAHTSSLSAPGSTGLSPPPHLPHTSYPYPGHFPLHHSVEAARLRQRSSPMAVPDQGGTPPLRPGPLSQPGIPSEEESSEEDEHKQVTQRLLAAVLLSERDHKTQHQRNHSWGAYTATRHAAPSRLSSDLPPSPQQDGDEHSILHPSNLPRTRHRAGPYTSGQAAVELFLRLSRARQTVDFSKRQAALFSTGTRCVMDVWEALEMLNELREFEAVLLRPHGEAGEEGGSASGTSSSSSSSGGGSSAAQGGNEGTCSGGGGASGGGGGGGASGGGASSSSDKVQDMTLMEHALQTAELCRLHWPDKDHMHLAGLIHGLGKLLAHKRMGSCQQWQICGESFPLGCRFSPSIQGSAYFSANADKRRRMYCTQQGMYSPHCGLSHVIMSWGAAEFLHLVLCRNRCQLPAEAMFCLRFQKFFSLRGGAYDFLLDPQDLSMLPLLKDFMQLCEYKRRPPHPGMMRDGTEIHQYYSNLAAKYLQHPDASDDQGRMRW